MSLMTLSNLAKCLRKFKQESYHVSRTRGAVRAYSSSLTVDLALKTQAGTLVLYNLS